MRRAAVALMVGLATTLGGCGPFGDGDDPEPSGGEADRGVRPGAPRDTRPKAGEPAEAGPIRAWNAALNDRNFEKAASYFAKGAIVEQLEKVRLRDRRAAIEFNRSLPCRSEITDVDDEGRTILVAFRLLAGRGGACRGGGTARVRFRVKDGRFTEWRQLSEPQAPGEIA